MKPKALLIAAFTAVLLTGLGSLWLAPGRLQQAPEISFTTLRGQHLSMASLRGRPVLVNFWASTCRGCLEEMPELVKLYKDFAPRGLAVIGIAMAYDPPDHVVALSKARNIPYPIALDINSKAARAFGDVGVTPTSFLIAPDGRVVHRKTGELDIHEVRQLIAGMLTASVAGAQTTAVN
jgi:peroxiredoxin